VMWKVAPLIAMAILPAIQAGIFVWNGNYPMALMMVGFTFANSAAAWIGIET